MSLIFSLKRNTVLAASAGTGKTFHLTGALLHLVLGTSDLCSDDRPLDASRIVATTFSRKAAAEIRERVVVQLERLASAPETSPYLESLQNAARRKGTSSELRVLSKHARKALASVDRANITTLHGLALRIAQRHAIELGRSREFSIASEEEATRLTRDAIERAAATFADERPTDIERLLTLCKGTDRLFDAVARALSQLEEMGAPASAIGVPSSDGEAIEAKMIETIDAIRPLAQDPIFADAASAASRAWNRKDMPALRDALGEVFAKRKSTKASDEAQAFWRVRDSLVGGTIAERADALVSMYEARDEAALFGRALADLVATAQTANDEAFARARAMSFGGVLRAARDVMLHHPSVAADWAKEVDALLVDEFQDTSRLQRDLLLLLWQNDPLSRSAGKMPRMGDLRPRGLLVVGDRKQSIYAFRGADVGVFTELCVGLAGEPARDMLRVPSHLVAVPLRPSADFYALRDNHRSKPELIAFANAFARARLRAASTAIDDVEFSEEAEALRVPATSDDAPYGEPRAVWMRPTGDRRKTTRLEDARVVTEVILDFMRAPWTHPSASADRTPDKKTTKWRDFAVLAHSNEMLDAAAHALAQAAVPYVVAGRGFYQAQEVRDLCSMLTALARPRDRRALLEVLRGPWTGASDRTLLGLTEPHRGVPSDLDRWGRTERSALIDPVEWTAIEHLRRVLVRLRSSLHRLGPGGALRAAVLELRLEETLVLLPRGEQRVANVRKFLAIAETERDPQTLLRRLVWADENAREAEAAVFSDDDDAVRLLTIHASKGLDFRVVLLPEVGADGSKGTTLPCLLTPARGDWQSEQASLTTKMLDRRSRAHSTPSHTAALAEDRRRAVAERHRLLYVAVTRAAEHLIFVGDGKTDTTLSHTLNELANDPALRIVNRPFDLSAQHVRAPSIARTVDLSPAPALVATARALPIATTALRDFGACPRRFEWIHSRGVPETVATILSGDFARERGAIVHRVLECVDVAHFGGDRAREAIVALTKQHAHWLDPLEQQSIVDSAMSFLNSTYAKRVASAGAEILREVPFVIEVGDEPVVALRGTIDLVVRTSGNVDVIDYKNRANDGPGAHAVQLDVYTLAAHVLFKDGKVRAGIVSLEGDKAEPRFRAGVDEATLRARLATMGGDLARMRAAGKFPRIAVERCRAIRCGFVGLCHARDEAPQLALF